MNAKKKNKVHLQKCTRLSSAVKTAMNTSHREDIVPAGAKVAIKSLYVISYPKKELLEHQSWFMR